MFFGAGWLSDLELKPTPWLIPDVKSNAGTLEQFSLLIVIFSVIDVLVPPEKYPALGNPVPATFILPLLVGTVLLVTYEVVSFEKVILSILLLYGFEPPTIYAAKVLELQPAFCILFKEPGVGIFGAGDTVSLA